MNATIEVDGLRKRIGATQALVAAILSLAVGTHTLSGTGIPVWPTPLLTEARMAVGTAALLALAAVLALAVGTIAARSAPAIAAVIAVILVPYLLTVGPQGARWPLQATPVAALSVQQALPEFAQVAADYRVNDGYFPLAPWAGLGVECAWAAAALALAYYLLRRRDA